MEVVKKHILSIICGVIALMAVVLSFWPLGSIRKDAQDQLDKRASLYGQLKSLKDKPYYMPVLDMANSEPAKLEGFPNRAAITKAKELQEELAKEKNSVIAAAEQANKKQPLVAKALPEPLGSTDLVFRDAFLRTMAGLPRLMKAGHPPTQAEVDALKNNLYKNDYEPKIVQRDGVPDPESSAAVKKAFDLDMIGLADREKRDRASEISLYLAPDGLQVMPGIAPNSSNLSAKTIWYAQLSLWLQMDVIKTVTALNADKSVLEAPVKQWVKFEMDAMPYRLATAAGGAAFSESWTGRVCNPLYDVVKFRFVADVKAADIPRLLQELGRGRFVTPLNVDVVALDANALAAAPTNMIYGADPVARVTVRCESLFLRSWTLPLMPAEVKKELGIASTGPRE